MRKLALALCAASALVGAHIVVQPAVAGVAPAGAIPAAPANALEEVQYRWRGRSYCFYPDGWNGPGWYQCGLRHRRGMGWGGPMGWRGWDAPRGRMYRERPGERRMEREMDRRRDRAPQREMDRRPDRGPERGMERAPERGAAPGTERRPPAGGERGAAPGGERGAAPGGAGRTAPTGERPRDVRPPAGAPGAPGAGGGGGGAPAGGAPAPGPN
jgi:hypothetical protein